MGMDVYLYAEGAASDDQLATASRYFEHRVWIADWDQETGDRALVRDDADWWDTPRVEMKTSHRHYGDGYERGDWPDIYGAIRCMQAAFPGLKVFYGSDSSDHGVECTEEYLAEVWQHFLGPDGDAYRRR